MPNGNWLLPRLTAIKHADKYRGLGARWRPGETACAHWRAVIENHRETAVSRDRRPWWPWRPAAVRVSYGSAGRPAGMVTACMPRISWSTATILATRTRACRTNRPADGRGIIACRAAEEKPRPSVYQQGSTLLCLDADQVRGTRSDAVRFSGRSGSAHMDGAGHGCFTESDDDGRLQASIFS